MPFQSSAVAAAYLAAMIDGEGTVARFNGDRGRDARFVAISNTDHALIAAIEECCNTLGITYTVNDESPAGARSRKYNHWTPIRQVRIYGQRNFRLLLAVVPIQAPGKQARLRRLVDSYVIPQPVDLVVLHRLYYDEMQSLARISPVLGIGVKTLRRTMREQGLALRQTERSLKAWRTRRERGHV